MGMAFWVWALVTVSDNVVRFASLEFCVLGGRNYFDHGRSFFLLFAHEIWRLYYNGPETCSPPYSPPGNGPTCASIDAEIYELAIIGIIFFGVSGFVFFLGGKKGGAEPVRELTEQR